MTGFVKAKARNIAVINLCKNAKKGWVIYQGPTFV